MEWIFVLAVIWFVVNFIVKKVEPQRHDDDPRAREGEKAPLMGAVRPSSAPPIVAANQQPGVGIWDQIQDAMQGGLKSMLDLGVELGDQGRPQSMLDLGMKLGDVPVVEGASRTDRAGCIGGSMGHGAHEGKTEFRPDMARKEEAAAASAPPRQAAQLTPEKMRTAVVMAEILSPPKARRRGYQR